MKKLMPSKAGIAGLTWPGVILALGILAALIAAGHFLTAEARVWVMTAIGTVGAIVGALLKSRRGGA